MLRVYTYYVYIVVKICINLCLLDTLYTNITVRPTGFVFRFFSFFKDTRKPMCVWCTSRCEVQIFSTPKCRFTHQVNSMCILCSYKKSLPGRCGFLYDVDMYTFLISHSKSINMTQTNSHTHTITSSSH